MVEQVTAFRASDGKVFGSLALAAEHEARIALKDINIFNEGSINAIVSNALDVHSALSDLINSGAVPPRVEPTPHA